MRARPAKSDFGKDCPTITKWVTGYGWIELGRSEGSEAFVRALDEGGLVWEGKREYRPVDHALRALESGLKKWIGKNG